MGRPLRIEYPDAFYHITARGNERKNIFKSNRDQERFLGYLQASRRVALQIKDDKKLKKKIDKIILDLDLSTV
jgi:REP element-mobilizing transposase RayT